jgi:hypothetical protein
MQHLALASVSFRSGFFVIFEFMIPVSPDNTGSSEINLHQSTPEL